MRRFFITGEDLRVRWSPDNNRRTADTRDATDDIGENENCTDSPARPPWVSVNSRRHMTIMATGGLPHHAVPGDVTIATPYLRATS